MILLDKIYCPEEQVERANKALRLNGGSDCNYDPGFRLLAASSFSSNKKPTLRIKRLSSGTNASPIIKLKGALNPNSKIQRQLSERQRQIEITEKKERELERINAEKALRLNSCSSSLAKDKFFLLLSGPSGILC
jgi:hypothetical protein